jgi:uncharacterized repeat protein (TIGR04052 family)
LVCTILFILVSCSETRVPVSLEFVATWDGQPLSCSSDGLALTDLRFYVSDVRLLDSSGTQRQLHLIPDTLWQDENVVLIDLESGDGACINGTREINSAVIGTSNNADIVGVIFTLGVPFEFNHANPLLAEPPLDDAAMHWHWRSGYKFLRAGISTDVDGVWMHLGSTGCEGAVHDISGCRFPNRVSVEVADYSPDSGPIEFDLAILFGQVDLEDGIRTDCSSGPSESDCAEPFGSLGLTFGGVPNQHSQRVIGASQ